MSRGQRIFVCGPITGLIGPFGFDPKMRELIETVTRALTNCGHHILSAHHLEFFGERVPADPAEVYARDWSLAGYAQVFIFLLPSDGEGRLIRTDGTFIELGWATARAKPIFVLTDPAAEGRSYLFDGLLALYRLKTLIDLRSDDPVAELVQAVAGLPPAVDAGPVAPIEGPLAAPAGAGFRPAP